MNDSNVVESDEPSAITVGSGYHSGLVAMSTERNCHPTTERLSTGWSTKKLTTCIHVFITSSNSKQLSKSFY